jgi:hypothetical protein
MARLLLKRTSGLEGFFTPMPTYKTNFAKGNVTLSNNLISAQLTPKGIDYAIDIDRKSIQHRNNNGNYLHNGRRKVNG